MDGVKPVRSIAFKVFADDGGFEMFRRESLFGFSPMDVERQKIILANQLESAFPGRYFKFVKIRNNRFNVIPMKEQANGEANQQTA